MAIKFSDLEVSNFDIEQIKLSNNTTLLLPRLNNKEVPCIILPKVTLSHYGVPKANAKYYKTDRDRMFIQLPLEPGETLERFELIDCTMQSEKMKQQMFGTTNNCEYSPLVKYGAKGPYIKVKLETDFGSDAIETVVWFSEKQDDGTIVRMSEPLELCSIDEFAAAFPMGSNVLCSIRFVKVWCINKKYGLTIKLVKANVLPGEKKGLINSHELDFDF